MTFLALSLTACGASNNGEKPSNPSSSAPAAHTHTFDETTWANNETQHWHPATCEHTSQKKDAAAHTFETFSDADHVNKEATCSEPGVKHEKCSVCNYIKTTELKAEHDFQDVTPAHEKGEGEVTETIKKCSRDDTYQIAWNAQDSAKSSNNFDSDGKWSSGGYAEYKFYSPSMLKARLYVKVANRGDDAPYDRENKTGNQSLWYDYYNGGWKYTVTLNTDTTINQDNQDPIQVGDQTYGMDEIMYSDFLEPGESLLVAPWFEFNVNEGQNTIRIARNKGYSVSAKEFYVVGVPVA